MYVHLHCHSHYSFLRAVPRPEEIVAAAVEHKMPAVALTDTNGLYAAVPFYQAAREAGVKPIVGAALEIETRPPWRTKLETRRASGETDATPEILRPACGGPQDDKQMRSGTILLLAADAAGYTNLCKLVTDRQLGERPLSLETLHGHREGLIALCEIPKSENGKAKIAPRGLDEALIADR